MSKSTLRLLVVVGALMLFIGALVFALTRPRDSSGPIPAAPTTVEAPAPEAETVSPAPERQRQPAVIARPIAEPEPLAPSDAERVQERRTEQEVAETARRSAPEPRRVVPPSPVPLEETAGESATPDAGDASLDEAAQRLSQQREYVQEAFRDLRNPVKYCYERILLDAPDATDRLVMVVEFVADEDDQGLAEGRLMAIESGEWEIDDLTCFANVVDGVTIQLVEGMSAGETTTVRYPFQFTAIP